jgi:hypothetical protein
LSKWIVTVQAAILLEATFGARRFKTASKDGSELQGPAAGVLGMKGWPMASW